MLHEGLGQDNRMDQFPTDELHLEILHTIKRSCEGATIGSPKIIALNDIAERYAAQSRVLESEVNETSQAERVAALVAKDTIERDIKHRSITISGYAQAHRELNFQAFRLVSVWKSIIETSLFPINFRVKNPEQSVSLELGHVVEEFIKYPNFSKKNLFY